MKRDLSGGGARALFSFSFSFIPAPKVAPGKVDVASHLLSGGSCGMASLSFSSGFTLRTDAASVRLWRRFGGITRGLASSRVLSA